MSRRCKVCHTEVVERHVEGHYEVSYRHLFAGGNCPSRMKSGEVYLDILSKRFTYDPDDPSEETPYVEGLH